MDFFIALDKNNHKIVNQGKTLQSHIIYIPPGMVALLSLYNMVNLITIDENDLVQRSCLTVKKLSFSRTGDIEVADLCDKHKNIVEEMNKLLRNRVVRSEPVYQDCKPWVINPCHNFALLPTPGFYVLETDDLDQLQDMYVEYSVLTAEQAIAIPDSFKLGVI